MATHVPKVRLVRGMRVGWIYFKREQKSSFCKVLKRESYLFGGSTLKCQVMANFRMLRNSTPFPIEEHHPSSSDRGKNGGLTVSPQDAVIFKSWPGEHFIPYTWDITTEKFGWMHLAFTQHKRVYAILAWMVVSNFLEVSKIEAKVKSMCYFRLWLSSDDQICPTVCFYQRFTRHNNLKPNTSQSSNQPFSVTNSSES